MADWQRRLDIKDAWRQAKDGEITPKALATIAAYKLAALEPFGDPALDNERAEIIQEFRDMPNDGDVEDFDQVWERLYDWADTPMGEGHLSWQGKTYGGKKACWVAIF